MIVAGVLRTRWNNYGGDPSTMRAKRPPNARDGARCDTAVQSDVSRKLVTHEILTQLVDQEMNSGGIS